MKKSKIFVFSFQVDLLIRVIRLLYFNSCLHVISNLKYRKIPDISPGPRVFCLAREKYFDKEALF